MMPVGSTSRKKAARFSSRSPLNFPKTRWRQKPASNLPSPIPADAASAVDDEMPGHSPHGGEKNSHGCGLQKTRQCAAGDSDGPTQGIPDQPGVGGNHQEKRARDG